MILYFVGDWMLSLSQRGVEIPIKERRSILLLHGLFPYGPWTAAIAFLSSGSNRLLAILDHFVLHPLYVKS